MEEHDAPPRDGRVRRETARLSVPNVPVQGEATRQSDCALQAASSKDRVRRGRLIFLAHGLQLIFADTTPPWSLEKLFPSADI